MVIEGSQPLASLDIASWDSIAHRMLVLDVTLKHTIIFDNQRLLLLDFSEFVKNISLKNSGILINYWETSVEVSRWVMRAGKCVACNLACKLSQALVHTECFPLSLFTFPHTDMFCTCLFWQHCLSHWQMTPHMAMLFHRQMMSPYGIPDTLAPNNAFRRRCQLSCDTCHMALQRYPCL